MKRSIQLLAVATVLAIGFAAGPLAVNAHAADQCVCTSVAKKSGWHKNSGWHKSSNQKQQQQQKDKSGSKSSK